jgi:hypothetical protein
VLLRPSPEHTNSGDVPALEPEALIAEARRRARRRRAAFGAAALLAIAIALGAFFGFGGGTTTPGRSSAPPPSRGLPAAADVVGTQRVPLGDTVLFAARGAKLFEVELPSGAGSAVTLARVAPNGRVADRRTRIARAAFLMDLSTGHDGVYAGSYVIKRFADVPDELVRIDPATLAIRSHAFFPSRVATVEQGARMWASLGDGRVLRLDPRTLATLATRRLLPRSLFDREVLTLSKPAFGLGSVWVVAGDERKLELVRMDPSTLAVRSRTRVPTHGFALAQALYGVSADARHVYLVGGRALVAAAADGRLVGRPALPPNLATSSVAASGLVGLTGVRPGLVLLTPDGRVSARTPLRDAGAQIVVSGRDAWFLGNAGHGNGIVHVRLRLR